MAGHFKQIYRLQCSSFILLLDTKNLLFSHKKLKEFIGRLACHADDFKGITGMFQAIFYVTTMDEQICEKTTGYLLLEFHHFFFQWLHVTSL